MSPAASRYIFSATVLVCTMITIQFPKFLSDENGFLRNFVNQEFLAFLGIVVTIGLGICINLNLELMKFEADRGKSIFRGTRRTIKLSAIFLIWILFIALLVVIVKPLLLQSDLYVSFINSAAIYLIV